MTVSVFEFESYRKYLNRVISTQPRGGHGFKAPLAEAGGLQASYLSKVLKGEAQLNLEQAAGISQKLKHNKQEKHYFLLLVQLARSGSRELKEFFREQISEIQTERSNLKKRFRVPETLAASEQAIYYSHWRFAALHILSSIPEFQTVEAMAARLGLKQELVSDSLDYLVQQGLVIQSEGRYQMGVSRVHIGVDSPHLSKHHQNWRLMGLRALDRLSADVSINTHYSSVVSLSKKDVQRIREILVREMETFNQVVKDSAEEELFALTVDFFKIEA